MLMRGMNYTLCLILWTPRVETLVSNNLAQNQAQKIKHALKIMSIGVTFVVMPNRSTIIY